MKRLSVIVALLALQTSASAQLLVEAAKGIKFGVGCTGSVRTFSSGFGTCVIDGEKARIWCPNGQIFDRGGDLPQSYVARSICNLNQILE